MRRTPIATARWPCCGRRRIWGTAAPESSTPRPRSTRCADAMTFGSWCSTWNFRASRLRDERLSPSAGCGRPISSFPRAAWGRLPGRSASQPTASDATRSMEEARSHVERGNEDCAASRTSSDTSDGSDRSVRSDAAPRWWLIHVEPGPSPYDAQVPRFIIQALFRFVPNCLDRDSNVYIHSLEIENLRTASHAPSSSFSTLIARTRSQTQTAHRRSCGPTSTFCSGPTVPARRLSLRDCPGDARTGDRRSGLCAVQTGPSHKGRLASPRWD